MSTRERVRRGLERGQSLAQVSREIGVGLPTVSYHARGLGRPSTPRPTYDWIAIQAFYDAGHSVEECQAQFGFNLSTWYAARRRGDLVVPRAVTDIGLYLVRGRRVDRGHLKKRLLAERLKLAECERCGLSSWRESALSLCLHHVNGDGSDNRLENLQLLCPNCHSQTPTFSGRNVGRRTA